MKKLLALALAALMLLALLPGCAAEEAAPETEQSAQPEDSQAPEETPQEAPEAPEEAPEAEPQPPEETVVDSSTLYPLFDEPHIFTIIGSASGQFISVIDTSTFIDENMAMDELEAATGCNIEFVTLCSDDVYQERFNLMAASNEYPDLLCKATQTYTGGGDALVEDEICIDMTPYLDQRAPELAQLFATDKDYADAVLTSTGKVVGVNTRAWPTTSGGSIIRQDWLDELGLQVPATYDELHQVLTAFQTEYGCTNTICIGSKLDSPLSYGFNVAINSEAVGWFAPDGEDVICSLEMEGTRDYIQLLADWYADGLYGDDFLSFYSPMLFEQEALAGNCGFWNSGRMSFNGQFESRMQDDDNFAITPVRDISKTGTETSNVGGWDSVAGKNCLSVSTQCEYPEEAISFINYLFTEEGQNLANYGVQGVTYDLDSDGNPYYLDLIINNADGYNSNVTRSLYTAQGFLAFMQPQYAMELTYTNPRMGEAEEIWGSTRSNPEYTFSLNAEQSEAYSVIATDLNTFANEQLLGFVVGDRDVSEWDAFMDELAGMGLEDMRAIQQEAFEAKYK